MRTHSVSQQPICSVARSLDPLEHGTGTTAHPSKPCEPSTACWGTPPAEIGEAEVALCGGPAQGLSAVLGPWGRGGRGCRRGIVLSPWCALVSTSTLNVLTCGAHVTQVYSDHLPPPSLLSPPGRFEVVELASQKPVSVPAQPWCCCFRVTY